MCFWIILYMLTSVNCKNSFSLIMLQSVSSLTELLTAERLQQSDDDQQEDEQSEVMSQLSVPTRPTWEETTADSAQRCKICIKGQFTQISPTVNPVFMRPQETLQVFPLIMTHWQTVFLPTHL